MAYIQNPRRISGNCAEEIGRINAEQWKRIEIFPRKMRAKT
jgi:hypothetical protein